MYQLIKNPIIPTHKDPSGNYVAIQEVGEPTGIVLMSLSRFTALTPEEIATYVPSYSLSKLVILQRIIKIGKGEAFVAALSSQPLVKALWDAAQHVDRDNDLLITYMPIIATAIGMTDAELTQVLRAGDSV